MNVLRRSDGFTLIELVIVIVLLGIVSVTVASRWVGRQEYEVDTLSDQLVTRLRLIQLRNMNEPDISGATPDARCSWLRVDGYRFGSATTAGTAATCAPPPAIGSWDSLTMDRGNIVTGQSSVLLQLASGSSQFALHFDRLGRPLGSCQGGCQITISAGSDQRRVVIEAEGYIHAG